MRVKAHSSIICSLLLLILMPCNTASALPLKAFKGPTPNLDLLDTLGKRHRLADYRGTTVLVQFWATYCVPCRKEIPSMNRLHEVLGDKLAILAINIGETESEVKEFIQHFKPDFTILYDTDRKVLNDWNVIAAPASFLIGPDGTIRYSLYGKTEWDSKEMIERILEIIM